MVEIGHSTQGKGTFRDEGRVPWGGETKQVLETSLRGRSQGCAFSRLFIPALSGDMGEKDFFCFGTTDENTIFFFWVGED